jgi:hypothetical protein
MTERLSAEDRMDILELLARYAHAMDDGDSAAFMSCFIPEPVLDVGYRMVTGSSELREFADYYAKKPGRPWYHHISTVSFEGDAERCQARSYLLFTTKGADGDPKVSGWANYLDDCVKVDGHWLFAKHTVRI